MSNRTGSRAEPLGRLAPSPTGVLHLGNARSFLLAWLSVRSRQGVLKLRIEDIDGPRVKPGGEQQAMQDLLWLGLDHDGDPIRQSDRIQLYREAVDSLVQRGLAYPCVCTRKEVEAAASAPQEDWLDAPPYPGTCRDRFESAAAAQQQTGRDPAIRFRVDLEAVPFEDVFCGPQAGRILGDFVIEGRQRSAAYQLAVVLDDAASGVSEVLRGDDLLPSTPRQLLLYDALGLAPPKFAHVPLLVGEDGLRLAKRHGDTSLRHVRERGVSPEEVVGYLAYLCRFRERGNRCTAADLLEGFDLDRLPPGPVIGTDHGFPLAG